MKVLVSLLQDHDRLNIAVNRVGRFLYRPYCLVQVVFGAKLRQIQKRNKSVALLADEPHYTSSYEKGCQGKKLLPASLREAGVVTYVQPHLIPHLILRGVMGLVALARRTFPRRCQPQLLVPTRRFHEVSGARRRSVPKLRKLSVGLGADHDPMSRIGPAAREIS